MNPDTRASDLKTESRVQSVSLAAVSVTPEPRPSSRPRPSIQVLFGMSARYAREDLNSPTSPPLHSTLASLECSRLKTPFRASGMVSTRGDKDTSNWRTRDFTAARREAGWRSSNRPDRDEKPRNKSGTIIPLLFLGFFVSVVGGVAPRRAALSPGLLPSCLSFSVSLRLCGPYVDAQRGCCYTE